MPIFIPSIPEGFNGSYGEKEVFDSLKILSNQYVVFHSLSWVGIGDRTLGEADFVVLHPEKGVLVIEVKSGKIEYKNGDWFQTNSRTQASKVMHPFTQAKRSQYEILERLERNMKSEKIPIVGHGVWFPSIEILIDTDLPPEAPRDLTLDRNSLYNPVDAIDKAFAFWIKKRRVNIKLNNQQFKDVLDILCPYFNAIPKLSTSISEAEQYYIKLTNQQSVLLNFLQEQDTAVIHGLAGTGKTILAVEKARMLSAAGSSVLFLCYNSFLKDYLKKTYSIPNVVFHNVHSLAYTMLPDPTMTIDEVLQNFEEYLDQVYEADDWEYKNVVIDEGQDIDDRLLNRLNTLVKEKGGCFYVFYDRNQFIMRNNMPKWIDNAECRLVLHKNCRNTVEITKTSCSILGMEALQYSNDIHGTVPNAKFYKTEEDLKKIVEDFARHALGGELKPEDVVILTSSTEEKSWINKDESICGYEISNNIEPNKILFTTIRKFKGLEAKAIIIVDISMRTMMDPEMKKLIYVGSSRAKYLLTLAINEDLDQNEIGEYLKETNIKRNVPKNKKGFGRLFHLEV